MSAGHDQASEEWTEEISGRVSLFKLGISELWRYRDLILLFVNRDFLSVYKQTILGPLWLFLQPLLTSAIYIVVFNKIAGIQTEGMPILVFYLSGILIWQYFSNCLTKTSTTFISNSGIFGKVYFPRLVLPISSVVGNLISFGIQTTLFVAVCCYYYFQGSIHPTIWIITLPLLIALLACLGLGFGIIISSLTIKYRDLNFLVSFAVQLWMFATPIIYPLSSVPEKWKFIIMLNPVSSFVELNRYAFTGIGEVPLNPLLYGSIFSLSIVVIGIFLFNRSERTFIDKI